MKGLKTNDKVNLVGGLQATVVKELGRGGQGIVYLVELLGKKMALKWYLNAPDDRFYKNLESNVKKGVPSGAFLWPEYVTMKEKGSYGYIMPLRSEGYYEFGQFYLARVMGLHSMKRKYSVNGLGAIEVCHSEYAEVFTIEQEVVKDIQLNTVQCNLLEQALFS